MASTCSVVSAIPKRLKESAIYRSKISFDENTQCPVEILKGDMDVCRRKTC